MDQQITDSQRRYELDWQRVIAAVSLTIIMLLYSHFTFEFRAGIRNKNLLLMNYLFPLGLYLMMSLIMPGINPPV